MTKLAKKNVLVTGVAGFLGHHLAIRHLNAGDNVLGIDNFCSSTGEHVDFIEKYASNQKKKFTFVEADVVELDQLRSMLCRFMRADSSDCIIYNFASPASPPRYQNMPTKTLMTNVVGTENILNLAYLLDQHFGANISVVHASTSEIYGDPTVHPQHEEYHGNVNCWGPRACYDEGKRAAETLCYEYSKDIDVRVVRIFNTYGPGMDADDGRVVSNFINQALKNEDITIYGSGDQTRSFCYVDDLIDGIVKFASVERNKLNNRPVNLGNPAEFTIKELAEKVLNLVPGSKSKIIHVNLPKDDPHRRRPDISEANRILNWEPKISLDVGLKKTIAYFEHKLKSF